MESPLTRKKCRLDSRQHRIITFCLILFLYVVIIFYHNLIDLVYDIESHLIDFGGALMICGLVSCIVFEYIYEIESQYRCLSSLLLIIGAICYIIGGLLQHGSEFEIDIAKYWFVGSFAIIIAIDVFFNELQTQFS